MIRNTAYSRFKPIPFIDVIINERLSRCRHIVNLLDLSGAISSMNLSHRVIHFENMTFAEQVSSLRFTRVLVSMHGAGLSNIIFLQPGSTVIELMHPLMSAPFYRFLSYYPLSITFSSKMWSLWMIPVLNSIIGALISITILMWMWLPLLQLFVTCNTTSKNDDYWKSIDPNEKETTVNWIHS